MNLLKKSAEKKVGLNTLISWGASVVIVGLMFKILHFRGGEWMIAIGLTVEAILFALLGFAAMKENDEPALTPAVAAEPATAGLEKMLATSVEAQTLERLRKGFDQFTHTVESVNQIAGSSKTTTAMITEIEQATKEVQLFRKNLAELNMVYTAQLDAFKKN